MADVLEIRKYKNRRLYDTEASAHLTHQELLERIRSGRKIRVREVGTEQDVTVETLLQVILKEDGLAANVLSADFLQFLLRAQPEALTELYRRVLPQILGPFGQGLAQFAELQRQAQAAVQQGSMGFSGMPSWPGMGGYGPSFPASPAGAPGRELEEMKDQLEKMRQELEAMKKD